MQELSSTLLRGEPLLDLLRMSRVIVASGVVKDEDAVALVEFFFTKFSTDPTIVAQLVVQEPTSFTGSE
ncbi:hypothetical protein SOVF_215470 isoform C, partial [Spinacia oleracea]